MTHLRVLSQLTFGFTVTNECNYHSSKYIYYYLLTRLYVIEFILDTATHVFTTRTCVLMLHIG